MTDTISQHIATLLRRNDCVIVPGIGAFVATRREALVSENVLLPPAREITFNPAMTHDDGLLATSVSRRLRIPFVQAREKVAAEIDLLRRRLRTEGAVSIAHVGMLRRRSGGRLDFMPGAAWIAMPSVNIVKPSSAVEVTTDREEDRAVAVVRLPLRLRWLRVAAAVAILSVLGFSLSTPIDIDTAHHASLAAPMFTAPEEPEFEPMPEPSGLILNLATAPSTGMISIKEKPAIKTPQPYVIVVGSLPTRAKAEEYIAETGIPSLEIIQSGNKFRVYAAEGSTPEDARAAAATISGFSSRFPDAWVCRR